MSGYYQEIRPGKQQWQKGRGLTRVSVRAQGRAGGSQESARAQLVSCAIGHCDFSLVRHSGVRDKMLRRSQR